MIDTDKIRVVLSQERELLCRLDRQPNIVGIEERDELSLRLRDRRIARGPGGLIGIRMMRTSDVPASTSSIQSLEFSTTTIISQGSVWLRIERTASAMYGRSPSVMQGTIAVTAAVMNRLPGGRRRFTELANSLGSGRCCHSINVNVQES